MEVFMAKSKAERGRFSSRKKMDVVLRVLRGDDLDLVYRKAGITAATVTAWRDQFVASGQAGLKSRADDGRDDELARLKAMVEDLTMRLELSREAVQPVRGGTPFGYREVDAMSHTTSPSTNRPYGVVRVCQEWGVRRSTFYNQQDRVTAH
jgi:hypothetical protein